MLNLKALKEVTESVATRDYATATAQLSCLLALELLAEPLHDAGSVAHVVLEVPQEGVQLHVGVILARGPLDLPHVQLDVVNGRARFLLSG